MVWDLGQCSKRLSIKVVVWLARDCKNLKESASPRLGSHRSINTHIFTMLNLNLDSLMGASGLQSSLKCENSKQGFVRKSDGSNYNRTRGPDMNLLILNGERGGDENGPGDSVSVSTFHQNNSSISKTVAMHSVDERIKDIPSRPFPLQVPLFSSQRQLLTPLFCRPVIKKP